ncbi:MAG TPA: cytochrome c biogenesis protein CcdA [Thermomicrobiales bacterium]|nr:cytochrome c biogenesis protein CcdA [Thermomicrobiales bacterium]
MTEVTFLTALIAGVFSITSPCMLPLIPIYLTHIAGVSAGEPGVRARALVLRNAAAYVIGFSVVFIVLGAALGTAGALAGSLDFISENRLWLVRIGGVLLLILGLHQLGWITVPFLNRTRRANLQAENPGTLLSSFLIGVTFGAGWSPCVGPILGAILTMAAGQGSIGRATTLLTVYSLGLAVPFMLAALAFGSAPGIIRKLNSWMAMVTTISGAVMIGVGAIMILGVYEQIFIELIRVAPWTPYEPEI